MKYETLRRIKRKVGEVGEFCSRCGCRLVKGNRSLDSRLCNVCFGAEIADLEAEDMLEDSLTDSERLAKFSGYFFVYDGVVAIGKVFGFLFSAFSFFGRSGSRVARERS